MLSSSVKIENLDYLSPSVQCIKPVSVPKPRPRRTPLSSGAAAAPPEGSSVLDEIREESTIKEAVRISLNDCLACSGCITTAETVLVQLQSVEEVYKEVIANKDRLAKGELPHKVVITLAPQASASVAAYFRCSAEEAFQKLTWLFKHRLFNSNNHKNELQETPSDLTEGSSSFGWTCEVSDGLWAQNIALLEQSREFIARYRENEKLLAQGQPSCLPLLTSACPGWICYAEKTHPELIPYVSTTKPPQAIAGATIKGHLASRWGIQPSQIYHLSIFACFDKKLEAAREDFSADGVRDTDCVLSSLELLQILEREQLDWNDIPLGETGSQILATKEVFSIDGLSDYENCGGYLEFVFRFAAHQLFGKHIKGALPYKQRRSPNWQEVTMEFEHQGNTKTLCFAIAYGFQQIQNITRMIGGKTKTHCPYQFVEVMACPSGCLNGGGQIKASQQKVEETNRDLLARVTSAYQQYMATMRTRLNDGTEAKRKKKEGISHNISVSTASLHLVEEAEKQSDDGISEEKQEYNHEKDENTEKVNNITEVGAIYEKFVAGDVYSDPAKSRFHTQYHPVKPTLETQGVVQSW